MYMLASNEDKWKEEIAYAELRPPVQQGVAEIGDAAAGLDHITKSKTFGTGLFLPHLPHIGLSSHHFAAETLFLVAQSLCHNEDPSYKQPMDNNIQIAHPSPDCLRPYCMDLADRVCCQ